MPTPRDRADATRGPVPSRQHTPNRRRRKHDSPQADHPRPPIRSPRAATVARWFGLDCPAHNERPRVADDLLRRVLLRVVPGSITLIAGASGAGKSSLLRSVVAALPASIDRRNMTCLDLAHHDPAPGVPLVDGFDDRPLEEALRLMSRTGLGEAWTYLRTPDELSDGQRWRLRLALALHRADGAPADRATLLVADEFAAVLDRVTAMVVARALRRIVDGSPRGLCAILATAHDDLIPALAPDTIVRCDFGRVTFA